MTKKDLVKRVHDIHGGVSYRESQEIVEKIFQIIRERLIFGDKVTLSGFGVFRVTRRRERRGRNPQTGEMIEIRARRFLSFKPSKLLDF